LLLPDPIAFSGTIVETSAVPGFVVLAFFTLIGTSISLTVNSLPSKSPSFNAFCCASSMLLL